MKVTRDGELVMSEEELELQREMYRRLQTQSGKAPQPESHEKLSFDHGFGRFDTAAQQSQAVPRAQPPNPKPPKVKDEFVFNFDSSPKEAA
jgi:hypothetical protein